MLLRKYGAATTVLFPLIDRDAADFETAATFVAGDSQLSKDEAAFANTANLPASEGNGIYSIALTATEMQAARIVITVRDATPKSWEDQAVLIETYGHASAQHEFDLDDAGNALADLVLKRPIAGVEPGAAFRTLYGAIASLVNRARINASGNLEVYKTDDATVLSTLTATTDAAQQPIKELDPP